MNVPTRIRWQRDQALPVAERIAARLAPFCQRVEIAGSLRRQKPFVHDVEILYVPKPGERRPSPRDLFETVTVVEAEEEIARMEREGVLSRRQNVKGQTTYGLQNKLLIDCQSGIPVDLFATSLLNWPNYLVCRTGPAELNRLIAIRAKARGWRWNAYGSGFTHAESGRVEIVESEDAVFRFVGLLCRPPHQRSAHGYPPA